MKNTALRAGNSNSRAITFKNKEHEKFYTEYLEKCRYQDVYHQALVYCLGIDRDTRENVNEEYGPRAAYVVLSDDGAVVMNDNYNGLDAEAREKIQSFLKQQEEKEQETSPQQQTVTPIGQEQPPQQKRKEPELANWQKVMDNGEYLRSVEMAEEANYNMIDGLMNNVRKVKDKDKPRESVLAKLRLNQKKVAKQGKKQTQQKAMTEDMERKKK